MDCLLCQSQLDDIDSFSDIFFSKLKQDTICNDCKITFEKISEETHCPTCWSSGKQSQCQDCKIWENKGIPVNHKAIYCYNTPMKEYISKYKFQGDYLLRLIFAQEVKEILLKDYKDYLFVPVPLSLKSYQERQFNQVTGILDAAQIPYIDLLQKSHTQKQSSKTKKERLNSKTPFTLTKIESIDKPILIIDDIYTSGATIAQIKQLFFEQGIKNIKSFSIAR